MADIISEKLCRICLKQSHFYSDIFIENVEDGSYFVDVVNDILDLDIEYEDGFPQAVCVQCYYKISDFQEFKRTAHQCRDVLLYPKTYNEINEEADTEVDGDFVPVQNEIYLVPAEMEDCNTSILRKDPLEPDLKSEDETDDDLENFSPVPNEMYFVAEEMDIDVPTTPVARDPLQNEINEEADTEVDGDFVPVQNEINVGNKIKDPLELDGDVREEKVLLVRPVRPQVGFAVSTPERLILKSMVCKDNVNGRRFEEKEFLHSGGNNASVVEVKVPKVNTQENNKMVIGLEVPKVNPGGNNVTFVEVERPMVNPVGKDVTVIEMEGPNVNQGVSPSEGCTPQDGHFSGNCKRVDSDDQKGKFKCKLCPKTYESMTHLIIHERFHATLNFILEVPLHKSWLNREGSVLGYGRRKVNWDDDTRTFKCKLCPKAYHSAILLKKHGRVHTGRSFKCKSCPKDFNESQALAAHETSHTGNKFYCCKLCDKPYFHLASLRRHELVHTDDCFKCDACDKIYKSMLGLRRHRKVHFR